MASAEPSGEPSGNENPGNTPSQAEGPGLAAGAPMPRRRGPKTFSSLQNNRDYRYLFAGNLCGNGAQWLQLVTIGWLALGVSDSAFHSIMAVAVRALPTLLTGRWAGGLACRWDRPTPVLVTQSTLLPGALAFALLVCRWPV